MMKVKKPNKYIFLIGLAGMIGVLLFQALNWESPDVNRNEQSNIDLCIQQDEHKLYFRFQTKQGFNFDIDFVRNSKPNCLNPYFPAIHIKTDIPHNAWLHVVYTDSEVPEQQTFIDSEKITTKRSSYPFYAYTEDFYDAPLWTYSLLNKPISFWKGHAFAVEVNHQNKTIKCLGGIEWGFELHFTKLRPVASKPKLLDEKAWNQAWRLLKSKLPNYELI